MGKVTGQILNSIGIVTCQDLYDHRDILHLLFSSTSFQFFMHITLGLGSSSVDRSATVDTRFFDSAVYIIAMCFIGACFVFLYQSI